MATSNLLKAAGLHTFNNNLTLPEGALNQIDNANIDREGVIESRRGFKQYKELGVDTTNFAKQLIVYKERVLAHYPEAKLAWDGSNATQFTDFSETINEVESGLRIKYVELNGNLYFTTASGIKKISITDNSEFAANNITDTGVPRALGITVTLDSSQSQFFSSGKKVGYRVVWFKKDANDNLIYGYPSPLVEIDNPGTSSAATIVSFQAPEEITTTDYYYQLYRTDLVNIDSTVTDELKLVYEGQYSTSSITINDVYSESLRVANTNLYTNIFSGEGIAFGNIRPPIAHDITTYKNFVFLSNVKNSHQLSNSLLGVSQITPLTVSSLNKPTSTTMQINFSIAHGFGLTETPKIVLSGTNDANGVYTATVSSLTQLTITVSSGTTTATKTPNAVVYKDYFSITKGLVTNNYFPIGRRHKQDIVFTPAVKADCNNDWIVLYSAENRVKYLMWFDSTGTNFTPPTTLTGATYIRIDLSDAGISTSG